MYGLEEESSPFRRLACKTACRFCKSGVQRAMDFNGWGFEIVWSGVKESSVSYCLEH